MSNGSCPQHGSKRIDVFGNCNAMTFDELGSRVCDYRVPRKSDRPIRKRQYSTPGKHHALIAVVYSPAFRQFHPSTNFVCGFMVRCTGCCIGMYSPKHESAIDFAISHVEHAEGYR